MEFLQTEILWGVQTWRLGTALLLIFFGFLSRKIISVLFEGVLKRRAAGTSLRWDDDVVDRCSSPLALVSQIFFWYLAAVILALPDEPVDIRLAVFRGLEIAITIAATWLVFRLLDVLALAMGRVSDTTDSKLDDQLVPLLRKTLKVFVGVVVGVMIVQNLGYSVTSIIASLGIGGLALALAAKDTVANFFGSLIVFTDQPFHVGDWIEIDGLEGTVEEVGFRTTLVRQFDKSLATVPNQKFTAHTIINYTRREMRRVKMLVGVTYETNRKQLADFVSAVRNAVDEHPKFADAYYVHFDSFGDSSLNILVYCFTNTTDFGEYLAAKEDLMLNVMKIVAEHDLEIAFPTRTVYLRDEQWGDRPNSAGSGDGRLN